MSATDTLSRNGVFRTINGKPIRWENRGVIHSVEGSNVHPNVRLLWTDCQKDVPANTGFISEEKITCPNCLTVAKAIERNPSQ